jgi:NADPH:quinone reductase
MRAVVVDELGGPETLRMREWPEPAPGPGQIAIETAYVGINFADVQARASGHLVTSLPFVPGLEASGHVRALGEGVRGLSIGQPVTAITLGGAYADVVLAPAELTFAVPDGIDLRMAATLPIVLITAHALVHEVGRVREGESVLVHSAAGGVGTIAGQLARLAGAGPVLGVASTSDKARYALRFGYDDVFLADDFEIRLRSTTGDTGVDLALDAVGGGTWRRTRDALAPFGRLVSFGNAGGEQPWTARFNDLTPNAAGVHGFSISTMARTAPDALRAIAARAIPLVAERRVYVPITGEYPLEQAADAHRLLASRASTGKLVLRTNGPNP